jgi:hypothetical protein
MSESASQTATIRCPFCPRLFGSATALRDHAFSMRRKSATHGLHRGGKRRTRQEIEAILMEMENGRAEA